MKAKYAFLLLALALLTGPLAAQAQQVESFVAKTTVSDDAVTFKPQGNYVGFNMKVAGPGEFYYEQNFNGEEVPSFSIMPDQMGDGSYTIRVTAQPIIEDALRAKLEDARAQNDRALMKKLFDEAGLSRRSMIHSLNIGIVEGKFLDPYAQEAPAENLGATIPEPLEFGDLTPVQLSQLLLDGTLPASGPTTDATSTMAAASSVQGALVPADVLPASLAPYVDVNAQWLKSYFQATTAEGTTQLFEAYMQPVEYNGLDAGSLFLTYFRTATEGGEGFGPWFEAHLQSTGDALHLMADGEMNAADNTTAPALFDYVTETEDAPAQDANAPRRATVLATNDGVIRFSLCVGGDCPNSPSFGADTIRLQENNLRIHFDDTSNSGSFPNTDYRLTGNSTQNGGANYFSIDNASLGRSMLYLEASSRNYSIFTKGDFVGFGTDVPVLTMHGRDGNTPGVRLEQDNSDGFNAYTWDIAGNETNFFVRDINDSSNLPFRIFPGTGDDNLVLRNGRVGVGTDNPGEFMHLKKTGADDAIIKLETSTGLPRFLFVNGESSGATCPSGGACNWFLDVSDNEDFRISVDGSGQQEFQLTEQGDLTVTGNIVSGGGGTCDPGPCDGTFKSDFEVPTIDEHAAFMWENSYLWGVGPTIEGAPINLSKKTTGILHELEVAHIYIEQLHNELKAKTSEIESLNERLTRLERLLEAQDQ